MKDNFPNIKKDIVLNIQEAYRAPNRLDQTKIPLPYNNQNTKHTD